MHSFHTPYLTLVLVALILSAVHYYCYRRIIIHFNPSVTTCRYIRLAALLAWIMAATALPLVRNLPLAWSSPIAWVAFSWFGILLLLFLCLLIGNLVTGAFLPLLSLPENEGRRLFLKRALGIAALGMSGTFSVIAFRNGMRPPQVKTLAVPIRNLPKAFHDFHVVQITDLHIGPTNNDGWLRQVVERVNALEPDLIAITGDLVDGSVADLGKVINTLQELRSRHGSFFVTGNHEYYSGVDAWTSYLTSIGIKVLRNERVAIEVAGQSIDLAGVEDFESDHFPGHGSDLGKALEGRDASRPVILLAHQPASVIQAAAMGVDLQLSGHTHGGQIRPFDYAVRLRQPYIRGLHRHPDSDTQIYVSCGTGYWGPPMRLGTASEITSVKLYNDSNQVNKSSPLSAL